MRLDKFLSDLGLGSRKDVKKLIKDKRVVINNQIVVDCGLDVRDKEVYLDGKQLYYHKHIYILYHKPMGVVCANEDNVHETVFDRINHPQKKQLFCVGRLDKDTTGALLITNDGQLDYRLRRLKSHVNKIYEVTLKQPFDKKFIPVIEEGIKIGDEQCAPARIEVVNDFFVRLTLQEGKYHQVKRMMIACQNEVIKLHRSHFSFLSVENLDENSFRMLSEDEVRELKR